MKEENSQLKNEIKTIANETKLQTELALKDKIFELQSQVNQINSEKIQIEQLKNEEIEKIIKDGRGDLPGTALELVERANRNGGKDNIAVVLIEPLACEVEEC